MPIRNPKDDILNNYRMRPQTGPVNQSAPYRLGNAINNRVNDFVDVQRAADKGLGAAVGAVNTAARDFGSGLMGGQKVNPMTQQEAQQFTSLPLQARRSFSTGAQDWRAIANQGNQGALFGAPTQRVGTPVSQATMQPNPPATNPSATPQDNMGRVGNRLNTMGGYIQSNDQAGMDRVQAGLSGVQPKDGQPYISNNFSTMPAYQTPQWLIQARELKAQREQARGMGMQQAAMQMPEAPKLQTFDGRTQSFSDLGNVKRQNRLAREAYALQMGAYNNALDNAGATQREGMQNQGMMQRQQMENQGRMEQLLATQNQEAPYRQAMTDYYGGMGRRYDAEAQKTMDEMQNPQKYMRLGSQQKSESGANIKEYDDGTGTKRPYVVTERGLMPAPILPSWEQFMSDNPGIKDRSELEQRYEKLRQSWMNPSLLQGNQPQ